MRGFVSRGVSSWVALRLSLFGRGCVTAWAARDRWAKAGQFCEAPAGSRSPCPFAGARRSLAFTLCCSLFVEGGAHVDLTRFSPKQKEVWGHACNVAWPCA